MTGEQLPTRIVEIPDYGDALSPAEVEAVYRFSDPQRFGLTVSAARNRGLKINAWPARHSGKSYARWEDPLGVTVTVILEAPAARAA
jgi:hypothetical protein